MSGQDVVTEEGVVSKSPTIHPRLQEFHKFDASSAEGFTVDNASQSEAG